MMTLEELVLLIAFYICGITWVVSWNIAYHVYVARFLSKVRKEDKSLYKKFVMIDLGSPRLSLHFPIKVIKYMWSNNCNKKYSTLIKRAKFFFCLGVIAISSFFGILLIDIIISEILT